MAESQLSLVHGALTTSTGNHDFTSSGFGTPVASIILATQATAQDTTTDHAMLNMGFTDGTTDLCTSGASQTGVGTSYTSIRQKENLYSTSTTGTATLESLGDGSLITDGVRLNMTNATAYASRVLAINFGTDVTHAKVVEIDLGTGTSPINTGSLGFEPKACICFGTYTRNFNVASVTWRTTYGVATPDDEFAAQHSAIWNSGTGSTAGSIRNDCVMFHQTSSSPIYKVTTTFNADDIDFTPSASSVDTHMAVLVLGGDAQFKAELNDSGSGTGVKNFATAGYDPTGVLLIGTQYPAVNTWYTDNHAESIAIGAISDTSDGCCMGHSDDGPTTTDTHSRCDTRALIGLQNAATVSQDAAGSLITGGYSLNYSTNTIANAQHIALMIGDPASSSVGPLAAHRRRLVNA